MLFKSPIFSQASGSIAGMTFSHNRGGQYVRNRSTPTNPDSPAQQAIRAALASAVAQWKNLTDANRESWANYAANTPVVNRLGDSVFLTGQQQWIRTYTVATQAGLDPFTLFASAPTVYDLGDTGTITLDSAEAGVNRLTFGVAGTPDWAADDAARLITGASLNLSKTINFHKAPFRNGSPVSGDSTTPVTSTAIPYGSYYLNNTVIDGRRIFARYVVLQSDGRVSRPNIVSVDTSA